ncbi:MAG: TolC family protein [Planctomycetaceae bacterium]|nr:TolC family protein [Planctomycetaceae bacterium]
MNPDSPAIRIIPPTARQVLSENAGVSFDEEGDSETQDKDGLVMRCWGIDRRAPSAGVPRLQLWCVIVLAILVSGCQSPNARTNRAPLAAELQERTCHDLPAESSPCESILPPDVDLLDGLSEEEAIATALWNNAQFHSTLSQLGMAWGDIVQSGLLTNPQFQYYFGGGSKQIEYTLYLPVEALVLRKQRITITEREYCRVSQELVQNGLNLVRDVRVAYADFVFAVERASLAEEALQVRSNIADLSEKQFEAGDIGELESMTARIEALRAESDAAGLREQVVIARELVANLMGIGTMNLEFLPSDQHQAVTSEFDPDVLLADALISRPDLRAAQYAIAAADHRGRLAHWLWLRFDGIVDGNAGGSGATNIGPGIRFDIPIFDRNEGGIIRADWTTDQALHNFDAVRDSVVMEVRTAAAQLRQADASLSILQEDVLPPLREAIHLSEQAYRDGGISFLLTLQSTTQFLDARARELELSAARHRALAELERSVGRRLVTPQDSVDPVESSPLLLDEEIPVQELE